ncbi:MAG: hypothetical protein Q4G42_08590 [Neisseria sp.]|nr:hypothetical protein [Neisseria sp.]
MKKLNRKLALFSVLLLGACVHNDFSSWQKIGSDRETKAEYLLDTAGMQRNGDTVTFRNRIDYPQTVTPPAATGLQAYRSMIGTWRINCRTRSYALLAADFFDDNGRLLRHETFNAAAEQNIELNQSALHKQYKRLCLPNIVSSSLENQP